MGVNIVSTRTYRFLIRNFVWNRFLCQADSYDPKTGIRKTGQEVVFQLDQSGVAARPCVTKSQNHETWVKRTVLLKRKNHFLSFWLFPPLSFSCFPVFRVSHFLKNRGSVFQKFATWKTKRGCSSVFRRHNKGQAENTSAWKQENGARWPQDFAT